MDKNPLFVFLSIIVCLSGIFGFYHYTTITKTIEETSSLIGVSPKAKDDIQQVVFPQEFIDFVKQGDVTSKGNLSDELFSLKKMAFTACLYQISSTTSFWRKEESANKFIKDSKATLDQIGMIEENARLYVSKNFFTKKTKSDILISVCLDYYDSRELRDALKLLEKGE
jgi:hypothetical protein